MSLRPFLQRLRASAPGLLAGLRGRTLELRARALECLPGAKPAAPAAAAPARTLGKAFGMDLGDAAEPRTELGHDAPAAPRSAAADPRPADDAEFSDLLDALGSTAREPDLRDELLRRDAQIAELQGMLSQLRGLGDELARTERARVELEQRVRDLETALEARVLDFERALAEARAAQARAQDLARASAAAARDARAEDPQSRDALPPDVEKLLRDAERREAILARERERHAATRAKLAEKKQVAAERWRELQTLRGEVKRLERAVAEASAAGAIAAPLPAARDVAPLSALMQVDPAADAALRDRAPVQ